MLSQLQCGSEAWSILLGQVKLSLILYSLEQAKGYKTLSTVSVKPSQQSLLHPFTHAITVHSTNIHRTPTKSKLMFLVLDGTPKYIQHGSILKELTF